MKSYTGGNKSIHTCTSCQAEVERQDCHKNRYGEYICRNCQAAGIKFTKGAKAEFLMKRWAGQFSWSLAGIALAAVFFGLMVLFFH